MRGAAPLEPILLSLAPGPNKKARGEPRLTAALRALASTSSRTTRKGAPWQTTSESMWMNYEGEWTPGKMSSSSTHVIHKRGRVRARSCQRRSASPTMPSSNTSPKFPGTSQSLPIALDPTKAQAPVWRKNFASADTRMSGPCKADLTPGAMQACPSNPKQKQHSRQKTRNSR